MIRDKYEITTSKSNMNNATTLQKPAMHLILWI